MFAWSGAAEWVIPRIHESGVVDLGQAGFPDAYYRRGDRRAPHNLYSSTPALYSMAPAGSAAPPATFVFRGPNDALGAGARPVGGVDLCFCGGIGSVPIQFLWDPAQNGWARFQNGSPHVDEAGVQVAPQNMIVQFVPYEFDSPAVPLAQVLGTGPAWVFTNGHVIEATWSKTSPEAVTQYVDAAGRPIGLTPGRTWVELFPNAGAAVGTATVVPAPGPSRAPPGECAVDDRVFASFSERFGVQGPALARAIPPSQRADGLGVRRNVVRSTATRPNLGP